MFWRIWFRPKHKTKVFAGVWLFRMVGSGNVHRDLSRDTTVANVAIENEGLCGVRSGNVTGVLWPIDAI